MEEFISAAEAKRKFSALLRGVRERRSYVVTSRGEPVARIVPAETRDPKRDAAWRKLLARLREQPMVHTEPWTRDELYNELASTRKSTD